MKTSALLLTVVSTSVAIAGPHIIGDAAESLSSRDVAAILTLADPHGSVWLLDVRENFFLSERNLMVEAYLEADRRSGSLRRGRLYKFDQVSISNDAGYAWQRWGSTLSWAQVAVPPGAPDRVDQPFQLTGDLSDEELTGLVEFIRGSPRKPSRQAEREDGSMLYESGASVDGTAPISEIEKKADCFFEVTTERRPGAGQRIQVRRGDTGWEIVEVMEWVV